MYRPSSSRRLRLPSLPPPQSPPRRKPETLPALAERSVRALVSSRAVALAGSKRGTPRSVRAGCAVTHDSDFLVIGGGIAGLRFALEAAKHGSVTLLSKDRLPEASSSYAQGGVAS